MAEEMDFEVFAVLSTREEFRKQTMANLFARCDSALIVRQEYEAVLLPTVSRDASSTGIRRFLYILRDMAIADRIVPVGRLIL